MLNIFNWRSNLVGDLAGDVLEIGVGAGDNLRHYRAATSVNAIEPDAARAADAAALAQRIEGETGTRMRVQVAPAERLPYDDARFDHAVSSLVFCSVADQQAALGEIARVLKPNGMLHMVEHVRPNTRALALLFDRLTPWWSRVENNCHLNRRTVATLQATGWRVVIHKRRAMVVRLSAWPPTASNFADSASH